MHISNEKILYSFPSRRCHNYSKKKVEERCRARCVLVDGLVKSLTGGAHNHPPHTDKINKIQKRTEPDENNVEYWSFENLSDVDMGDDDIVKETYFN